MKLTENELILHNQFSEYGKNAKEWLRKCALMLPKINRHRIWEKKGFSSIYEYAAKIAGMSRFQVQDALRIMHHIENKPAILKVAQTKGLNAIRPIAAIATTENQELLAEKANSMSKNTLETWVRDIRQEFCTSTESIQKKPIDKPKQVQFSLPAEIVEKLEQLKGQQTWEEIFKEFIKYKECQPQKPEPIRTNSRHIPTSISKYVKHRASGLCEHPHCNKEAAELHHTIPFSLHKVHDPDLIRHICKDHHSIAHHGLISNQEFSPESWQTLKQEHTPNKYTQINSRVIAHKQLNFAPS
ncbi:hypothetical protein COU74_05370 [Candidatus Peregrinibacteria bacterium CG10_big_fil_rev_8_21_14_0_10_36_19]|nr:MAG: hypothetical protein COU74_05370 [Candidatus Peregrinibacteria bacterium CG10_big_fil_rev_8_21_14_0_10_36_19]